MTFMMKSWLIDVPGNLLCCINIMKPKVLNTSPTDHSIKWRALVETLSCSFIHRNIVHKNLVHDWGLREHVFMCHCRLIHVRLWWERVVNLFWYVAAAYQADNSIDRLNCTIARLPYTSRYVYRHSHENWNADTHRSIEELLRSLWKAVNLHLQ